MFVYSSGKFAPRRPRRGWPSRPSVRERLLVVLVILAFGSVISALVAAGLAH
jgi:hypothetical protein